MVRSTKVGAMDMVGDNPPAIMMNYEQVVDLWKLFMRWDAEVRNNTWVGKDVLGPPDPSELPDWIRPPG